MSGLFSGWRQPSNAILLTLGDTKNGEIRTKRGRGHYTAEEAVTCYHKVLIAGSFPFSVSDVRRELKGKDLVCWCEPGAPCHPDVLLTVATDRTDWSVSKGVQSITPPRDR
jgi:hypothetical protein